MQSHSHIIHDQYIHRPSRNEEVQTTMSQGVGRISSNFQSYTLSLADVIKVTISNALPASLYLLEMLWYDTLHSLEQLRIRHLGKKKKKKIQVSNLYFSSKLRETTDQLVEVRV